MSWLVEWDELAEAAWKDISPQHQKDVSDAVHRFVSTRQGNWKLQSKEPEICGRLYVDDYIVFLIIDATHATVHVEWLSRRRK